MIRRLASHLPPKVLRFVGRLQFRIPLLRPAIQAGARWLTAREGVIRYGVEAGLRFDAGGRAGYILGTTEPEEQHLLAAVLREGDTFYDIGANVGFYSTIAARLVGPNGHVYAFEPYAPSAERARANAKRNGFNNVTVIEAAVAAAEGTATLDVGDGRETTHYRFKTGLQGMRGRVEAPVVSIDAYVRKANLRAPSVVMIDVEGGEIEVLRGMLGTIRTTHPVMMCEIHWNGDALRSFFYVNLKELGYEVATYSGGPLPVEPCRFHALLNPRGVRRVL